MSDDYRTSHEWHVAINDHATGKRGDDWPKFMYEGKNLAYSMPHMIALHRAERLNTLPGVHQYCSHSEPEKLADNHLTCCLGVKCRECPELKALEKAKLTPEQIDEAKAWTCGAHILMRGGDHMNEGYLLTTSDRMYWDRLHESLAAGMDESENREPTDRGAKNG